MSNKNSLTYLISQINNVLSLSKKINTFEKISEIDKDILLEEIRKTYSICINITPSDKLDKSISTENPIIEIECSKNNTISLKPEEEFNEIIIPDSEPVKDNYIDNINDEQIIEFDIIDALDSSEITTEVITINHEPKIIADKFKSSKTINDSISEYISTTDIQTIAKQQSIDDLNKAFGVNDKFRFANALFNNNIQKFNQAIWDINLLKNIDDAIIYISENYNWNPDKTIVQEFITILQRRFK